MKPRWWFVILFLIGLAPLNAQAANAAPRADVQADSVAFDFPNTATFSATLQADTDITSVTLEYGNDQLTCGDVIAKAFPNFTPGKSVDVSWTWDMRQSGSLPPGTTIWWRWRYIDSGGKETVSEKQTAIWLDSVHDWKQVSNADVRIHYYEKDKSFADTMLAAAVEGLRRDKEQAGMIPSGVIDIYVYPNYQDLQDAILYEPSWTGGQAFSEFNIIIMGLSGSDSNWDKNTVIHELTHVLVGRNAFSCIGSRPQWLEEGLAMYSEGALDAGMQNMLDQAIQAKSLITLRSLNSSFSELSDKANLSYAQSYSVVTFLIKEYGQEKMSALLKALSDAKSIDEALREVYGFDTDGLDSAWRESVGAPALMIAQATAMPTPTQVPTYMPISGAPLATTPTPNAIPTSSFGNNDQPSANPQTSSSALWWIIALVCCCLILLLILGAAFFIIRKKNSSGGTNG
ncbi:MAG: hypothetical protein IT310_03195 [Anaerolineales bacterium]|nr:hypothetical protein [Anaerolineales bacterium]